MNVGWMLMMMNVGCCVVCVAGEEEKIN